MAMLVTLDTVKSDLGILLTDPTYDAYLTRQILASSASIENYCSRNFEASDITQTFYITKQWRTLHSNTIFLGRFPVNSLTDVLIDGVILDPSTYQLFPDSGIIMLLTYPASAQEVVINYNGGYTVIPADIEEVANDMTRARYNNKDADPSRNVKSEQVVDVGTVQYESGLLDGDPIQINAISYSDVLDPYRSERALI